MKKRSLQLIAASLIAAASLLISSPRVFADFAGGITPLNLWSANVSGGTIAPIAGLQVPQNGVISSSTSVINVNGSASGISAPNGSFLDPYPSLSAALANSSGQAGYAYILAPGVYVDGAPDSFPANTYIQGNQSTYVAPSGATFSGQFEIYDANILGNITGSSTSTTQLHQINNSAIVSGNVTASGLLNFIGTTFASQTSSLTVASTGLMNFVGGQFDATGTAAAQSNFNDMEFMPSTSGYGWTQTGVANGGGLNILGMTYINTAGDGINVQDGATSTPNNLAFLTMVLGASATSSVNAGTAATDICTAGGFNTVTGAFIAPTGSNWKPCINEQTANLSGETVGTSTVLNNLFWQAAPSSTVRIGVTSTWPGCIEMYDAAASGTMNYIYTSATALVDTSTKPSFCQ
jgi:hypothetical protein